MFNRPIRTGKRTGDPTLFDNYDPLNSDPLEAPYDWSSDSQQEPIDKSISAEVVPSDDGESLPLFADDVEENGGKNLKASLNLDVEMQKLYKKYKMLRYAEELVRYFKTSIKQVIFFFFSITLLIMAVKISTKYKISFPQKKL